MIILREIFYLPNFQLLQEYIVRESYYFHSDIFTLFGINSIFTLKGGLVLQVVIHVTSFFTTFLVSSLVNPEYEHSLNQNLPGNLTRMHCRIQLETVDSFSVNHNAGPLVIITLEASKECIVNAVGGSNTLKKCGEYHYRFLSQFKHN